MSGNHDDRSAGAPAVLQFITGFCVGGSERQTVTLANGLARDGYRVRLACFRRRGSLLGQVAGLPCQEFAVDSFRRPRVLLQAARFAAFIRRHRVDLVHASGAEPNVFAVPAARLAGVPAIASVRDMGDPWTPVMRRAQDTACAMAEVVIANSEAVRRRLIERGIAAERIRVVHNSVRPLPVSAGRDPLAEEFGVGRDRRVIGAVARMVRVKGLEYLIEATARLAPRFPDLTLVLVGGPVPEKQDDYRVAYESELRALARERGIADRVVFTGDRDDVGDLLARFEVSVLPSLSEGFPNAVMEAMAAGVPVVASRVGGAPELIESHRTGRLVEPRDAAGLAEAIGTLLSAPEMSRRIGAAGRERVREHFSERRLVEATSRIYEEVLQRRARKTAGVRPPRRAYGAPPAGRALPGLPFSPSQRRR